ncbi:MAG: autotransporter domain-containing protein [Deltaproteobacteria bacterium]|nr:autotransporter domain-containing protein [Deltaproteobacteria bacterium]
MPPVSGSIAGPDAGLINAWKSGYTGRGVVIGIVDDGVNGTHEDLKDNYLPGLSKNFSQDPTLAAQAQGPVQGGDNHGTAVAGVAAARGGNSIGGTGAAPFAGIAGLRLRLGNAFVGDPAITWDDYYDAYLWKSGLNSTTLAIESKPEIQIKNHSYGSNTPFEEGTDRLKDILKATSDNGMIHVFAAGNARNKDNGKTEASCEDANKDFSTTSPYVITVAALGSNSKYASYSSYGANVFVTAPSSSSGYLSITTTDRMYANYGYNSYDPTKNPNGDSADTFPNYNYTSTFGGTSSAAPLVSGIMALGKEANPLMTVRMAKHALSLPTVTNQVDYGIGGDSEWVTNKAATPRNFNPNYGFGLIQADKFVNKIAEVAYVTKEQTTTVAMTNVNQAIPDNDPTTGRSVTFTVNPSLPVESVEVDLKFSHARRGDLRAYLTSPDGTKSRLFNDTSVTIANPLYQDNANVTDFGWTFLTNAFWGEQNNDPSKKWTLQMVDVAAGNTGTWLQYGLIFHLGNMVTQTVGDTPLVGTIEAESLSMTNDGVNYSIPKGSSFSVRDGLRLLKGKLTIDGSFDLNGFESTIDGTLAGVGNLNQFGTGTTTMNGDGSTFSGVYDLGGGKFNIGASGKLGGTMNVNAGTILAGTGQIGALNNNGKVKPGNGSVGTLKLTQFGASPAADYAQGSGGTLTVAVVTPTSNSLLQAQGSATLDGTLETLWQGSSIPHNKTVFGTILSAAAGVSGRFANLLGNKISPTLFFKPQYDRATEVYLMPERDYATSDLVSSLTRNQRAISQMLNPLVNSASGDLDTVLDKIDNLTTNAQVAAAFDQLSPIAGVAYTNMTSGVASFQTGNVASRLGDLRAGVQGFSFQGLENLEFLAASSSRQPFLLASNSDDLQGMIPVEPDPRWGFFVKGNLVQGDQKDTVEQRGYDFKNGGLTLGTDYRFSERFVGGVLFGMNAAKSWINDAGSTVKLDGYTLGIYGTYFREAFYIDGQAGYGWNSFDNSRRIVFTGIDRTATAKPSGGQTTAYGGTGYDYQFGPWTIGPALTFQYLSMGVNGYTEAGANSLNLQVDRQTTESYQGGAGVKGAWNWTKDKLKVAPRLWAFYRHEFGNVNPSTIAALAQGSSAFTIESVAPERNFFNVGTGVNVHWSDNVLAYLNYDAQLGQSNYSAQSVTLGLRVQF